MQRPLVGCTAHRVLVIEGRCGCLRFAKHKRSTAGSLQVTERAGSNLC